MRVGIFGLYSMIDRRTGVRDFQEGGAARICQFLAAKLLDEGYKVTLAVPHNSENVRTDADIVHVLQPATTAEAVIHWDVRDIKAVFANCGVALCIHNTMPLPVRRIFPEVKIIHALICTTHDPIIRAAMDSADLVAAQCPAVADLVRKQTDNPVTSWRLGFDERRHRDMRPLRDIDVFFVHRASATNYTHHREFIFAHRQHLQGLKVVYADPTGYLRSMAGEFCEYMEPGEYISTLYRSKVVVSLHNSDYGGESLREAVYAGCVPVVCPGPGSEEFLGKDWPFRCQFPISAVSLGRAVRAALEVAPDAINPQIWERAKSYSYSEAWPDIREDLEKVCNGSIRRSRTGS